MKASRLSGNGAFCFFFQAEDGIRDLYVTGVQTCALPISRQSWRGRAGRRGLDRGRRLTRATAGDEAFRIPLDLDDSFTRQVAVLHQGLSAAADAEAQTRT